MLTEYHVYLIPKGFSTLGFRATTDTFVREEVEADGSRWFEVRHGVSIFGGVNDDDCWDKCPFADYGGAAFQDNIGLWHQKHGYNCPPIIVGEWRDNMISGCGESLQEAIADLVASGKRSSDLMWV